jgi:hypothetical protein
MGREWAVQLHPGNTRFRKTIAELSEAYENASKCEKTHMAQDIVRDIKALGGRFLRVDRAGFYIVVNGSTAREKVSSAFRNRRKAIPHAAEATPTTTKGGKYVDKVDVKAAAERRGLMAPPADKGDDFVKIKRSTKWGF